MAIGSDIENRGRGRIVLAVFIALAFLLFSSNRSGPVEDGAVRAGVEDVSAPVMSWVSMPFRGIETFFETRRERGRALEENRELKAELRRLQDVEREKLEVERKLEAVRQHTFLPPIEEHRLVIARAVSETGGPFAATALLNVGRDQGIRRGSAVVSTRGLYGHVLRVGDRSSRVLRLDDPSSRISVMGDRTGERAILVGGGGARPSLQYVGDAEAFREGDVILSSGDEGVLPRGLVVGVFDGNGRVRLAETGRTADWVRVYVREAVSAPEEVEDDVVLRTVKIPVPLVEGADAPVEAGLGGRSVRPSVLVPSEPITDAERSD